MPPAEVENDFQLSMKIGAYYKFAKQIEPSVAVSYHPSLHFQMEHSYQLLLSVEDSWMLGIVATPSNGNTFEMHHKENCASSLQMVISLGPLRLETNNMY